MTKKTAAIIGGGPNGMSTARALSSEGIHVTVYEKGDCFGGIWKYCDESPMYDNLQTNIPTGLMEFTGYPCPLDKELTCKRDEILQYLVDTSAKIAETLDGEVLFNTEVVKVSKDSDKNCWIVDDSTGSQKKYDFVVVASGYKWTPDLNPNIKGLKEWKEAEPETISHAATYRRPGPWKDQRVLVIGGGSSGTDISLQLITVGAKVMLASRGLSILDDVDIREDWIKKCPSVKEIDVKNHVVTYADGSSDKVDSIILATGYLIDLPYIEEYSKSHDILDPKGRVVNNLLYDLIYIEDPTLAFVGLGLLTVMPFGDLQAAVLGRVWTGKYKLPDASEMKAKQQKFDEEWGSRIYFEGEAPPPRNEELMRLFTEIVVAAPGAFTPTLYMDDNMKRLRDKGFSIFKDRLMNDVKYSKVLAEALKKN